MVIEEVLGYYEILLATEEVLGGLLRGSCDSSGSSNGPSGNSRGPFKVVEEVLE